MDGRIPACYGDCDTDAMCASGLVCQQRNKLEAIKGCASGGKGDVTGADYCADPKFVGTASVPLTFVDWSAQNAKYVHMQQCEGDCDADSNCAQGLKCLQRNAKEDVPGCNAGGAGDVAGWDYCYAPNNFCTEGYEPIMSLTECKEAVKFVTRITDTSVHSSTWTNWPTGCFYHTNGANVYYHTTGCKDTKCGGVTIAGTATQAGAGQVCVDHSGPAATCSTVSATQHTCTCSKGWVGDGKVTGTSCNDFDACETNRCPTLQGKSIRVACFDDKAPSMGYTCEACPSGYDKKAVNGVCKDTNACDTKHGSCHALVTCSDVPAPGNGATCGRCPAGYEGNGLSTDTLQPTDLKSLGGSAHTLLRKMRRCEGDCDTDAHCEAGLKCKQRNQKEAVPYCYSGGDGDIAGGDYCYSPSKAAPVYLTYLHGSAHTIQKKMERCEGDCDTDAHCDVGLKCLQRNQKEAVKGCNGGGDGDIAGFDYCYASSSKGSGCTDINDCAGNPCGTTSGIVCKDTGISSYSCTCPKGYKSLGSATHPSCLHVDACASGEDNCLDGATCNHDRTSAAWGTNNKLVNAGGSAHNSNQNGRMRPAQETATQTPTAPRASSACSATRRRLCLAAQAAAVVTRRVLTSVTARVATTPPSLSLTSMTGRPKPR